MNKKEPWILTQSGRKFNLVNPTVSQINIGDIASGLSRICRFNGQLKESLADVVYVVAQHSVYVKRYLDIVGAPAKTKPWGLLHDAPEYAYGDVTSPLKSLLPDYVVLEDRGAEVIRQKYNIPYDEEVVKWVKEADRQLLLMESDKLTSTPSMLWDVPEQTTFVLEDIDPDFYPWSPQKARDEFLKEFAGLGLE